MQTTINILEKKNMISSNFINTFSTMLRGNINCRLERLNEATIDWEMACSENELRADSYLLRLRKNIYTMLLDATNVNLMDLFVPIDKDASEMELTLLKSFYLCIDANDRKKAYCILQVLIEQFCKNRKISFEGNLAYHESLYSLYLIAALCSKHITPYKYENIEKALLGLKQYAHCDNPYQEQAYKSIITLSLETGDKKQLDEYMALSKQIKNPQSKFFCIELKILEFNYLFSQGAYDQAGEELLEALKSVSPLYLKQKEKLLTSAIQWQTCLKSLEVKQDDLLANWQCLLTLLHGYLIGDFKSESYAGAEDLYRTDLQMPSDRELGLHSFYRRSISLAEVSRMYDEFDNEGYIDFCQQFDCFLEVSQVYLLALTTAVHYYMNRGNSAKTSKYMKKAFDLRIPDYSLYISRATIWLKKGRLTDALHYFNRAVEQAHPWQSNAAGAYAERGYYYTHTYQYDQARENLEMALHMAPGLSIVHIEWGRLHTRLRDKEAAMQSFAIAESINNRDVKLYTTRAGCHMEFGQYIEALDDLIKAKELNPRSFAYLYNAACFSLKCELTKQAQIFAVKAAKEDPTDCRSHLVLAQIALKMNNRHKVKEEMEKVFKINPSDSRIFVFLAHLHLSKETELFDAVCGMLKKYPEVCIKANYYLLRVARKDQAVRKRRFSQLKPTFESIRAVSPHKPVLYHLEACMALESGELGYAFKLYKCGLEVNKHEDHFYDLCRDLITRYSREQDAALVEKVQLYLKKSKGSRDASNDELKTLISKCKNELSP